jgi:hypothetical protein
MYLFITNLALTRIKYGETHLYKYSVKSITFSLLPYCILIYLVLFNVAYVFYSKGKILVVAFSSIQSWEIFLTEKQTNTFTLVCISKGEYM